jgi:hypothetical protein
MARTPSKVDYETSVPGYRMDAVEIKQEDTGGAFVRRPVVGLGDEESYYTAKITPEGGLAIDSPSLATLECILEELKLIRMHLNQLTEIER